MEELEVCSREHVGGEADDEPHDCDGDQQRGKRARPPVGAGTHRWLGLTRVDLAQNLSRDRDVGCGDEHVTPSGGKGPAVSDLR
jgi:hypothetical protein